MPVHFVCIDRSLQIIWGRSGCRRSDGVSSQRPRRPESPPPPVAALIGVDHRHRRRQSGRLLKRSASATDRCRPMFRSHNHQPRRRLPESSDRFLASTAASQSADPSKSVESHRLLRARPDLSTSPRTAPSSAPFGNQPTPRRCTPAVRQRTGTPSPADYRSLHISRADTTLFVSPSLHPGGSGPDLGPPSRLALPFQALTRSMRWTSEGLT